MPAFWNNLPIRPKGLVVVAIPLVALIVATGALYIAQSESDEEQAGLRHIDEVKSQVQTVQALLLEAETGVRGYRLTMKRNFTKPYQAAFARLPRALASLEELVGDDAAQLERARRVRFLAGQQLEVLASLLSPDPGTESETNAVLAQDNRLMAQLRQELDAMLRAEETAFERQLDVVQASSRRERALSIAAILVGLLGGILATVLFTTGIAKRISVLEENARLLAQGQPLPEGPSGNDELGRLARELGTASALLSDREHRLMEARDVAVEASWAKSDFLSKTSHELRTPLSSILGFVDLLQRGVLPPEDQKQALDRIERAAKYFSRLLNDVLDIGLVEAGVLSMSVEPVGIPEEVADCVELMRPAADEANVRVESETDSCSGLKAAADPDRVQQVLLNLLSNAIKYNRPGGLMHVVCSREGPLARIDVSDEGPGVPYDHVDRLFTPYERFGADDKKIKGIGLGLALSKSLIELMGGTLELTSTGPTGSTFTVRIPLWEGPIPAGQTPVTEIVIEPKATPRP